MLTFYLKIICFCMAYIVQIHTKSPPRTIIMFSCEIRLHRNVSDLTIYMVIYMMNSIVCAISVTKMFWAPLKLVILIVVCFSPGFSFIILYSIWTTCVSDTWSLWLWRQGAWFLPCMLPCPLGTVLSPCLSAALHMASVVWGHHGGPKGTGEAW